MRLFQCSLVPLFQRFYSESGGREGCSRTLAHHRCCAANAKASASRALSSVGRAPDF